MSAGPAAPGRPAGQGDHGGLDGIDPLVLGILRMLSETPAPGWVSLPRLGKQLRASGSEVLRVLNVLSDARFGDQQGLGWVQVRNDELRWQARLTQAGRLYCEGILPAENMDDGAARAARRE